MNRKTVFLFVAAISPALAVAQGTGTYNCSYGELKRRVVVYTEPGVSVPCEVHYYKDTEAPDEQNVLWRASNDAAYCEQKAMEFLAKLASWGWDCGDRSNATAAGAEQNAERVVEGSETSTPEDGDEPPFIEDAEPVDEP